MNPRTELIANPRPVGLINSRLALIPALCALGVLRGSIEYWYCDETDLSPAYAPAGVHGDDLTGDAGRGISRREVFMSAEDGEDTFSLHRI
jgi:hypothetical protein